MATQQRRVRQGGQEVIEFGLILVLFVPLFMGSFILGMNLIRSIQANQATANIDSMYIHGADFSSYSMQQLAQRLTGSLGLQIGSSFTGNSASNTSNSGNALVTITKIMYVGPTTSPNCVAVGSSSCTNHDKFVFIQQIQFGNGTLSATHPSSLGYPTTTSISAQGVMLSPITDAGAALPSAAQTSMDALWEVTAGGRTPLQDGQVVYVAEIYSQSPDLSLGSFQGGGVYARYFF